MDMSCMDLPVQDRWLRGLELCCQEGGPVRARRKVVERKNFMPEPVPPQARAAGALKSQRWQEEVEAEMARSGWPLGGRGSLRASEELVQRGAEAA